MKILLIQYHDRDNINSREIKNVARGMGAWPPLGLIYIGTMLKQHGHDVEILDVVARGLDSHAARDTIRKARAGLAGLSATTPAVRGVMEAARFAKESGARVVVGGPHVEIFPEETLSFPEVDFAVRGDGEKPLVSLAETLARGQPDFASVPGLVYRSNGQIIKNHVYIEQELDSLPFPDWDLVPLGAYGRADALAPVATMVSGRGCPYRCGFCFRGENGKITRFRSAAAVVDEMEHLVRRWGIREIIFCNDTLTIHRPHIFGICDEILRRGLKVRWQGATRVDAVDPQMLNMMKRAGCKQLKFGIESGSGAILALMKKGITREQALQAVRWCRAEKIRTGAYFILGYAQETETTVRETIRFAAQLDPDFVMFYAGIPLPDTQFHALAVEAGKIDPDYWRQYVLGQRDDKLPYMLPDMDRWVERAFRAFYARPSFILRKMGDPQVWASALRRPVLLRSLLFPKNRD